MQFIKEIALYNVQFYQIIALFNMQFYYICKRKVINTL